jgi:hypothetical protein
LADAVTITIGATQLAILAKMANDFLAPRFSAAREASRISSLANTSGEKDPAFWQREFRGAIDEKLDQRIIPILENQSKILESQALTMAGIAKIVDELVILSRRRR